MHFLVCHLAIQYFEGVQVDAFVQRQDGIADGRIVSQPEVFLRGARGRGWMAMPVGKDFQPLTAGIPQCRKLVLWCKREMLWRVVDVLLR